jgi:hypothetical protein
MHFRTFIILGFLLSGQIWGEVGRKPAVEDFVGIEIEHPETTPQGTDSLVNLEKEIQTISAEAYTLKARKKSIQTRPETITWSVTNTMAIVVFMGLPLISWLFVMNRLRKRASIESASNVEVLEKYRLQREQSRKKEELTKKAS